MPTDTNHLQVIGATYNPINGKVRFTLKEWNTGTNRRWTYRRTYDCRIDDKDIITFPNDLTARIQMLCKAVCLCLKYKNTREGDS